MLVKNKVKLVIFLVIFINRLYENINMVDYLNYRDLIPNVIIAKMKKIELSGEVKQVMDANTKSIKA